MERNILAELEWIESVWEKGSVLVRDYVNPGTSWLFQHTKQQQRPDYLLCKHCRQNYISRIPWLHVQQDFPSFDKAIFLFKNLQWDLHPTRVKSIFRESNPSPSAPEDMPSTPEWLCAFVLQSPQYCFLIPYFFSYKTSSFQIQISILLDNPGLYWFFCNGIPFWLGTTLFGLQFHVLLCN